MVDQLFEPVSLGSLKLRNRIVMAPLTRARADESHVPTELMAKYYGQRSEAGLIVSEATAVCRRGMGWYRAPGIWSQEMVDGWSGVTAKVHENGGLIVCQLWHMGRLVLPDYLNGQAPLGPSPLAGEGETFAPRGVNDKNQFLSMKPYVVPVAMTQADINEAVWAFADGAAKALGSGFDGVEIHGANGYLIDQFLKSSSNRRTDEYGGSVHNRIRFLEEVVAAVTAMAGSDRVGLRISPTSVRKGMSDCDPGALTREIGKVAEQAGLAYVHLIEPVAPGFMDMPEKPVLPDLRHVFRGRIVLNGGFNAQTAEEALSSGVADAVSFGRPFIANPDFVARLRSGDGWAEPNFDYAYVGDELGYVDYQPL